MTALTATIDSWEAKESGLTIDVRIAPLHARATFLVSAEDIDNDYARWAIRIPSGTFSQLGKLDPTIQHLDALVRAHPVLGHIAEHYDIPVVAPGSELRYVVQRPDGSPTSGRFGVGDNPEAPHVAALLAHIEGSLHVVKLTATADNGTTIEWTLEGPPS